MMEKRIIHKIILLVVTFFFFSTEIAGKHASNKQTSDGQTIYAKQYYGENSILIINSFAEHSTWSNHFITPIFKSFLKRTSPTTIFMEHANLQRFNTDASLTAYKKQLMEKYKDCSTPRIIIFLANASWAMLKDSICKKWPDVPKLLCANMEYFGTKENFLQKNVIQDNEKISLKDQVVKDNLTVFYFPVNIKANISLMKKMQPDMDTLIFLSDRLPFSVQVRAQLTQNMQKDFPELTLENLVEGNVSMKELIDRLESAHNKSGVLFFSWFQDREDTINSRQIADISRMLSTYSIAPVFSLDNSSLADNGLIGGCMYEQQAIDSCFIKTVRAVIAGEQPKYINFAEHASPIVAFNYNDLISSGLSPDLCPEGTVFYEKPLTFWEQYKKEVIISIFIVVLLGTWLCLWMVYKTQKAQKTRLRLMEDYSTLLEHMPIVYMKQKLIFDDNGKVTDYIVVQANPCYETYLGNREKILGKRGSELGYKGFEGFVKLYNLVILDNRALSVQYYYENTQKNLQIIMIRSNDSGYVDCFCVDITESSRAQEMMRSINDKLSIVLEVANVVPWKWDLKKGIITCDMNNLVNLSGYESYVNENRLSAADYEYFARICDEDRPRIKNACEDLINGKTIKVSEEFRIMVNNKENPSFEWVEAHAIVDKRDEENKPISLIGSSLLITKQKKMENDLKDAKFKAEESNRLKSAFLANVSHEIRTPLNAIVGFSGILATTELEEEKTQYINIIESNNTLLLQLVNDILDLSKIEAGTLDFYYSDHNIDQLCKEMESAVKICQTNKLVPILYEAGPTGLNAHIEHNRVTQVMMNFLNNAMKFTKEGSIIYGFKLIDRQTLYFYVKDTGIGIPEDRKNEVFERFVKLNSFTQGTGLGLSICRTIVERMDGEIGVDSVEGEGSTFWFTMPYKPAVMDSQHLEETDNITNGKSRFTILIADDNQNNFLLYESILKDEYNLIHAWNGEEAVSLFEEYNPDVILMDINMPKMNGYDATQHIREISPKVPIMAVTAYKYTEGNMSFFDRGFDAFNFNPIVPQKFKDQIVFLLKKYLINN